MIHSTHGGAIIRIAIIHHTIKWTRHSLSHDYFELSAIKRAWFEFVCSHFSGCVRLICISFSLIFFLFSSFKRAKNISESNDCSIYILYTWIQWHHYDNQLYARLKKCKSLCFYPTLVCYTPMLPDCDIRCNCLTKDRTSTTYVLLHYLTQSSGK